MDGATYSSYEIRERAVHAVWDQKLSVTAVARAFGTDRSTVHRWLARYHLAGSNGLVRKPVSGRPRILERLGCKSLKDIVLAPASRYGYETDFWTTRRLVQVIAAEFGVTVSKQTILRRLHEAGLTYQKPEREYFELSHEERQAWVRNEVPKIRAAVRKHRAILYFQDEANVSLTALLAKTWGAMGPDAEAARHGKAGRRGCPLGDHSSRPVAISLDAKAHRVGGGD